MPDSIIIAYVIGFLVGAFFLVEAVGHIEEKAGIEMKVSAAWLFIFLGSAVWPLVAAIALLIGLLKAALNLVYVLYRAIRVEER